MQGKRLPYNICESYRSQQQASCCVQNDKFFAGKHSPTISQTNHVGSSWLAEKGVISGISKFAIGAAIYRSPEAIWARNPQEVSKRCSRASRPGVSKKCRKVLNNPKKRQKDYKISVRGLLRHFFDTPPRKFFVRRFGDFGARGCGDSCMCGLQTQL